MEAIPKDDSVISERRKELHKEVEVAKRNLVQQVNISSHLSFYLRMVIQSCRDDIYFLIWVSLCCLGWP